MDTRGGRPSTYLGRPPCPLLSLQKATSSFPSLHTNTSENHTKLSFPRRSSCSEEKRVERKRRVEEKVGVLLRE